MATVIIIPWKSTQAYINLKASFTPVKAVNDWKAFFTDCWNETISNYTTSKFENEKGEKVSKRKPLAFRLSK